MTDADIEASKAPLLDHLIELRSRLIKALLGFGIAFIFCFFFAKQIYNILVWPFVWVAGPENSKFIYTALLEYFVTQLKLAMFGAAFLSFPIVATQIYMFVAPGLYRNERKAFLPYLIATPIFFSLGALVVYFLVFPMLIRFSRSCFDVRMPIRPRRVRITGSWNAMPNAKISDIISDRYSPTFGNSWICAVSAPPACCIPSENRTSIGNTIK